MPSGETPGSLAEQAGDLTPDGMRRLLSFYRWAADTVRDDLRTEAYGDSPGLREWLEDNDLNYVMAVSCDRRSPP